VWRFRIYLLDLFLSDNSIFYILAKMKIKNFSGFYVTTNCSNNLIVFYYFDSKCTFIANLYCFSSWYTSNTRPNVPSLIWFFIFKYFTYLLYSRLYFLQQNTHNDQHLMILNLNFLLMMTIFKLSYFLYIFFKFFITIITLLNFIFIIWSRTASFILFSHFYNLIIFL